MAKNTLTTAFYQTEKDLKHPIPIRAYKDRIFRMIFKEKRALLALYNAMNDTAYQDPEELVITTLGKRHLSWHEKRCILYDLRPAVSV